jgi:hypothetical protein
MVRCSGEHTNDARGARKVGSKDRGLTITVRMATQRLGADAVVTDDWWGSHALAKQNDSQRVRSVQAKQLSLTIRRQ